MKIRIDLKDPDGVFESKLAAIRASVATIEGLSESESAELIDRRMEQMNLGPWVKYGEYVSIEIDTVAGTATVLRQS